MATKRQKTDHKNVRLHISGYYYFVKGADEFSLGTKDETEAYEMADVHLAKLDKTGVKARKFKVKDTYGNPDLYKKEKKTQKDTYLAYCLDRLNEKRKGRKRIRQGTFDEIEMLFRVHLYPFFAEERLYDIDHASWREYTEQVKGASDLANHRKVFGGFLKWCKSEGYINALPDIKDIPHHKRRKRRIIKPHELKLIFQEARGNLLLFLTCALFMGMRRSEIMKLTWDRVDFLNKYLVLGDDDVKTDDGRELPLNGNALKLLMLTRQEQLDRGVNSPYVFPNRRDSKRHMTVSGLKTAWARVKLLTGLDNITWHDFRATFEKYSNKSTEHTDTQKVKFAGASMDVQRKIYVSMDADDLRGLENVVKEQELEILLLNKLAALEKTRNYTNVKAALNGTTKGNH